MKDIILDKINQLIAEARKDRGVSAEARGYAVDCLAELKVFVEYQTI